MKTFKKFLSIILSVVMLMSCVVSTYAETYNDLDKHELTCEFIMDSEVSVEDNVILFSKTEQEKNCCNREIFFIVPNENVPANELKNKIVKSATINSVNSSPSIRVEEYDISISIKGWIKVSYSNGTSTWGQTAKVTSVSGGYTKLDSSVSVTSQYVVAGSSGKSASTGGVINQHLEKHPTSSSWSYTAPSTWHYIVKNNTSVIGAYCDYNLRRASGSTWTFTLNCNV